MPGPSFIPSPATLARFSPYADRSTWTAEDFARRRAFLRGDGYATPLPDDVAGMIGEVRR